MVLQIQGVINTVMPITSGISKAGNQWSKQEFIIETLDQYPKTICLSLMNDHITTSAPYLVLGNVIRVHFDIESREFNGRWFTNCRAYKVEPTGQMAGQPNFAQPISPYDQQAMDAQADGYFGNLPPQADNGVTF